MDGLSFLTGYVNVKMSTGYLKNILSGHDDVRSVCDHGLAVCCHCCNQLIIKPTVCSCAAFSDLDSKLWKIRTECPS